MQTQRTIALTIFEIILCHLCKLCLFRNQTIHKTTEISKIVVAKYGVVKLLCYFLSEGKQRCTKTLLPFFGPVLLNLNKDKSLQLLLHYFDFA